VAVGEERMEHGVPDAPVCFRCLSPS
jgi:hypothetical protein